MLKFLLVAVVFAVAVYLLVRVVQRRGISGPGSGGSGGSGGRPAPRPPRGPVGPDDDPDFLWGLDKRERDKRKRHPRKDDGPHES